MSCATECKLHALVLGDFQEELENNLRFPVGKSDNFSGDNLHYYRINGNEKLFARVACKSHSGMARTVSKTGLQSANHARQHQTRAGTNHCSEARLPLVHTPSAPCAIT